PEDRPIERQLARDVERDGREDDFALFVAKPRLLPLLADRDAANLVEEIHVPRAAAELAVGDTLEADVLLQFHRLTNRSIFHHAPLLGRDPPASVIRAGTE